MPFSPEVAVSKQETFRDKRPKDSVADDAEHCHKPDEIVAFAVKEGNHKRNADNAPHTIWGGN